MKILSLKVLLLAIVGILGLFVVSLSSNYAWQMLERSSIAESGQETNSVSDLLLASAGAWAIERGVTVTALNDDQPVGAEQRRIIEHQRAQGDASFREAMQRL